MASTASALETHPTTLGLPGPLFALAPPVAESLASVHATWCQMSWDGLESLLESVSRPAIVVDGAGRALLHNQAARMRLRVSPESMRLYSDEQGRPCGIGTRVLRGVTSHFGGCSVIFWEPAPLTPRDVAEYCARLWSLTPRQVGVLALLVAGKCNKSIALGLDCAVRTVELHVSAILDKSGCSARTELVAQAWESVAGQRG
jgi:DNA-binding CsgD family transcriptional regulator